MENEYVVKMWVDLYGDFFFFAKTVGNYGEESEYVNMDFIQQSYRGSFQDCYEFLLKF